MTQKPICFVIMGFGKKTDPSNGKTYDLNKTYKNIIKPAVIKSGHECIRADEIKESGIIDKSMYALLMHADLVIADITTYNPNAIYELGIRHAVRPFSTIILREKDGKTPFDLDHTRMFKYSHLGEDIGADEAKRCQNELSVLIDKVSLSKSIDSPLYEFINNITPPKLPESEYQSIIEYLADQEKHIFAIVEKANNSMTKNEFSDAAEFWKKAHLKVPTESYFLQQQALCNYKSQQPSEESALVDALGIITKLNPDGDTNDPETLGITGAIYKRLWLLNEDMEYLDRAILYYGKCFKIREDYYTGENYALCLNLKAQNLEVDLKNEEIIYSKFEANKVRSTIIKNLEGLREDEDFELRIDKKWIYATLAHCYYALKDQEMATKNEKLFFEIEGLLEWEIATYIDSKKLLKKLLY